MSPELWIAMLACVGSLGGAAFTYRASRATSLVESSKVDAAAYDRAKAIYESALATLEEQLERVRTRLETVTTQLAHEQDTSASMRTKVRELTTQVDTLERTVSDLRLQLSRQGIQSASEEGEDDGEARS